jgi:hypothetical protein
MSHPVHAHNVRRGVQSEPYSVEIYSSENKPFWDLFIDSARNATFLFKRDYMEYHHDRFTDYSLMVYRENKLAAVLPANLAQSGELVSHAGLTYGGLVVRPDASLEQTAGAFEAILRYLHQNGIPKLVYKQLPRFYSRHNEDDIAYCLFLAEARLIRRDCAQVVSLQNRLPVQARRNRQMKKASNLGLSIVEERTFSKYWEQVLIPRLQQRYGVKPVHSVREIRRLARRFPDNIHQYSVYAGKRILAGVTVYETPTVAHAQYIAGSDAGRAVGALDYLFGWLLETRYKTKEYLDFGICNEDEGRKLNEGLLQWKESFGARTMAHDFYEVDSANYSALSVATASGK